MPFYNSLNLLYLHIPKTGGMSIEEYLYKVTGIERVEKTIYGYYYDKAARIRVENERTLQHLTYNEIFERKDKFDINLDSDEMNILVSVRNPFDRIISEIFWNKRTGATENSTKDEIFQIIYKYLYTEKDVFLDNHKTPQYKFILNNKELSIKKNVFIVRTENLKQDMINLGFLDFDIHNNKNTDSKKDYREYFNEASVELIVNYYANDFIQFGYSTDINDKTFSKMPFQICQKGLLSGSLSLSLSNVYVPIEKYNTTIVTAFIRDINKNRAVSDYIAFGEKLLNVSVPKVVFVDKSSYEEFFKGKNYPLTHFILFELTDMFLYDLKPLITDFDLITGNKDKDTMEYIFVQCYKTEWLRLAIKKNLYSSEQFIWIDFGIYHMIKKDDVLNNGIKQMCTKSYNRLRIATCKFRDYVCPYNVYKQLTWNFAGSVVGGDIESLIKFADIVKKKILDTITEKRTIMWELCFWYLVKDVIPDLYDCYICGHDFRILELY
jgi:hypothetical protein